MQSKATTVDAYLSELPVERASAISALRSRIKSAAPTANESMQYGMPTYTLFGEMLFALASQKQNLALYVANTRLVAKYGSTLGATSIGKSCIRFRQISRLSLTDVDKLLAESYQRACAKGKGSVP